jgi:hypothetical protein
VCSCVAQAYAARYLVCSCAHKPTQLVVLDLVASTIFHYVYIFEFLTLWFSNLSINLNVRGTGCEDVAWLIWPRTETGDEHLVTIKLCISYLSASINFYKRDLLYGDNWLDLQLTSRPLQKNVLYFQHVLFVQTISSFQNTLPLILLFCLRNRVRFFFNHTVRTFELIANRTEE